MYNYMYACIYVYIHTLYIREVRGLRTAAEQRHCIVLYVLYCIVLYCIVLCCIVLYHFTSYYDVL